MYYFEMAWLIMECSDQDTVESKYNARQLVELFELFSDIMWKMFSQPLDLQEPHTYSKAYLRQYPRLPRLPP